jgi:hypothetical protein
MPITRLPLTQPIETRDGTLSKDSKSVNGYFESSNGKREFIKRPGLTQFTVTPALPLTTPSGFYYWKQTKSYYVSFYTNTTTTIGGIPYNNHNIYQVDANTGASTLLGTIAGFQAVEFINSDSSNTYLFFHTEIQACVIWKAVPTTISVVTTWPISAPFELAVPSLCTLDGYVVVGTIDGRIYTSNLNDAFNWNALNYVSMTADANTMVGLARHLNYIVAFGQNAIQFFYDAGTSPGSPLAPSQSYTLEIGCVNAQTISEIEQSVIWVGTSDTEGYGVYMLDGVSPVKVSTPYIDRILRRSKMTANGYCKSTALKINGHTFYILTLMDINVTIVYDVNEKVWTQWTSYSLGVTANNGAHPAIGSTSIYAEQIFRASYFQGLDFQILSQGIYTMLDLYQGIIYQLNPEVYNDLAAPIYYRSVTDIADSGTTKRKFYQRVEIVGDKAPATMFIRHSDDDYQNWSPYRSVDLNASRSQIYQTGAARRRAWEFLCTDNQPLRLDAAEIDFSVGELEQDGVAPTNYRT